MIKTREFPIGVVLSITHDRLLCDFGDVHEALEFLAGEPVWTHQLPRVADEAKPIIRREHPELNAVQVPDWNFDDEQERDQIMTTINAWLAEQEKALGATIALRSMHSEEHQPKGPLTEMAEMLDKKESPQ